MGNEIDKELSGKYCPRFAMIAVERGFITEEQAKLALTEQMDDDLSKRTHRLIGRILLEKGWITPDQLDMVLNDLFNWKS